MRYVTISKRLCTGLSTMLLMLFSVEAMAATLPGSTTSGGTTSGTTSTLQTLSPPRTPVIKSSTAVPLVSESENLKPMQTVTSPKLPTFSDYASAETFAANPANSCSVTPTPNVCAARASVSGIGSNYVSMPICPSTHTPVTSFGSRVYSPSGPLYYSMSHTVYSMSAAQYSYYAARYYSCAVNWGDYLPGSQYSALWDSVSDLPYLYTGQYVELNGKFQYINWTIQSSYQSACHTSPHVPASCGDSWVAGWHSHQTYYRQWQAYGVYCTRNAGYYPYVTSPPYPFAEYNAAMAPIGTASTTTICGKAYNTFTRKP